MRTAFLLSVIVAIIIGYVAVSTSDYWDAVRQHSHCLSMVASAAWPAEVCK